MRSISASVRDASGDLEDRETLRFFVESLLAEYRAVESKIARAYLLLLSIGAVYVFLRIGVVGELSMGPVKISKLEPIRLGIPPVLAYLAYSVSALIGRSVMIDAICDEVFRKFLPGVYRQQLHTSLTPSSTIVSSDVEMVDFIGGPTLLAWGVALKNTVVVCIPYVIAIAAVVYLFLDPGAPGPAVWIGAAVSALFVVFGAVHLVVAFVVELNKG
ncbi:hypothetical protein SAMN05421812_10867 [Asanoa hainanensis]|uniref:Uncharacterized protein n=1 Tax=Asanoa hainanensis TaxID=560556 RepID=A0A239NAD5_9ACTN|nr:hypothetical protein [Asanoa hainanensis]SNT51855.1 hypothetical protein SAMN05421812_10867 [Asanoa hainanensis]